MEINSHLSNQVSSQSVGLGSRNESQGSVLSSSASMADGDSGSINNYAVVQVVPAASEALTDEQARIQRTERLISLCTINLDCYLTEIHALIAEGINVNQADKNGRTPLWWAADHGHVEVVKALLEAEGINVNQANKNGDTPLYRAAYEGHVDVVKVLLKAKGIDVNQANKNDWTPLWCAASNGQVEVVKVLLEAKDINVNQANKNGDTPLWQAASKGQVEVVKVLLEAKDINVNQANKNGDTPLAQAAYKGQVEVVKVLLEAKGIDVNQADKNDWTPLWCAASNGQVEVVKVLLEAKGIDVNQANEDGDTPLWCAASEGHVEVVKALLEAEGIDVNQADKNGWTPLRSVASAGKTEVVTVFLRHTDAQGGLLNLGVTDWLQWLKDSPKVDHRAIVPILFETKRLMDAQLRVISQGACDGERYDLWLWCQERIQVYEQRVKRVFELCGQKQTGVSILSEVRQLMQEGVDVNSQDANQNTPLHLAARNGHADVVRFLLNVQGIEVNAVNQFGEIPFRKAAEAGNTEVVAVFLRHTDAQGGLLNLGVTDWLQWLNESPKVDHRAIVPILFETKRLTDAQLRVISEGAGSSERYDLWVWCQEKIQEGERIAQSQQASVERTRRLFELCNLKHLNPEALREIQFLVQHGVFINNVDSQGNTPLHQAARNGHVDVVRFLLNVQGIEVNAVNQFGNTALHLAASSGYIEVVRELLQVSHIQASLVNAKGQKPIRMAAEGKYVEIVKLLMQR